MRDFQRFSFYGRPDTEWAEINSVLENHGIRDAKALGRELNRKANAHVPEVRIEVVDQVNLNRTLGYLTKRPDRCTPTVEFAVMQPVSSLYLMEPDELISRSVSTIRFKVDRKVYDNGWRIEVVLTTDAKLDELLKLDCFMLPGETPRQAEERRYPLRYA